MRCFKSLSLFVRSLICGVLILQVHFLHHVYFVSYRYVSKWVDAKATKIDNSKVVVGFIKSNIFNRFGISKALVNDQGTHFCNQAVEALLRRYGVLHKIFTPYHP